MDRAKLLRPPRIIGVVVMETTAFRSAEAVRICRLLPGYVVIEDGVNAPVRGIADTGDGEISVIAKKLGPRTLAVEILCAVYGRSVGLPIPEPMMIFDDELGWLFGSVDVGHPNLAKLARISNPAIQEKLVAWPELLAAACFDELIVNSDRHDGNILFDGLDFTLIDHDMCLPHGMGASDAMPDHHSNILLDILLASLPEGDLAKRRLIKDSNTWIAERDSDGVCQAGSSIVGVCASDVQDGLISFVGERLGALTNLISNKVNPEQGRFNV